MSRFNPLMAIKNKLTSTKGGISLRRILIILQFSITQIFVIGTFVVVVQMNYFAHVDLGFSIEAIVNVDLPDFDRRKLRLFEKKVHSEPSIESVSFSSSIPSGLKRPRSFTGIKKKGADTNEGVLTEFQFIDPLYLNLYKMEIVAGRNFSFSDSLNFIIINEALTKKIGFNIPKDALDTQMILGGRQVTVIGVIKDYHSKSLHEEIDHVTFLYVPYRFSTASIKLFQAGSQGASPAQDKIEVIKKAWQVAYPESTFSYHFFDKNIESFYVEEYKFSTLLQIFSLVLIFIGCLGLYGLISFMVNRRMGEVAVRKVFGASSAGIMKLLSKDFVTMLAIAFLIAAPVSYYFMDIWLQGFAYHIAMKWWMFILPASTVLLIAFLSVSGQSLRAARCNPAETLKAE